MSWSKSKSYTLQHPGKVKNKERMDTLLKGILSSPHPDQLKQSLIQKIAERGSEPQTTAVITNVLDLTSKWYLEGTTELETKEGLNVYLSWAKYNLSSFEQFFSRDFLVNLLNRKHRFEYRVPVLIAESLELLQRTSSFMTLVSIMEAKASVYVREHPHFLCLKNFTEFLKQFSECIPNGDSTSSFCTELVHTLSLCSPPEEEKFIVEYIRDIDCVAGLLNHIWNRSDSESRLASLRVIFRIISSLEPDHEPSICLGSLVPHIPKDLIDVVVRSVVNDYKIDDKSMTAALQRMIDWLQWPTSGCVDHWIIAFLKGLASVQKYSILIAVTESKVEQIFEKIQFPPVRRSALNVISHMLLSFQHSPEPFHKVLPMVMMTVSGLKGENSENSNQCLEILVELLHILMNLHGGFPDLYDPVMEAIKEFPRPSADIMNFKLSTTKWTAHRDMHGYTPRALKSEMGKTGLFNLGNTCYMNSVLQGLYMCDSLRGGVLAHGGSARETIMPHLQQVFAFLSHSQRPAYAPMTFLNVSRPPWFTQGFQQDCSEFLKYLLDQLHEQEEKSLGMTDGQGHSVKANGHVANGLPGSGATTKKRKTLIEQNFGGKMTTTATCLNCRHQSSRTEMFMDIPLAFPEFHATSQKSLAGGDSRMTRSQDVQQTVTSSDGQSSESDKCLHLNDLLQHYLKPEKLTGDNKYHCDKCGGLQEGERKIKVIETPEYLILTLLRFSYDTRLHTRSKIFKEVKYPKTLVLSVDDHKRKNTQTQTTKRDRKKSLRSVVSLKLEECGLDVDTDCADIYCLCSVIVHSGISSDCGHYYCYARHSLVDSMDTACENVQGCSNEDEIDFLQDKWYLFNDSRVSYASYNSFCNVTQRFSKDTAYVLMYKKIDPESLENGRVSLDESIRTAQVDPPLRPDLRTMVNKDNTAYLQEQENAARKGVNRKRSNSMTSTSWYNWKDDDDKGSPGPCGGGGGLGGLDMTGSRFVY